MIQLSGAKLKPGRLRRPVQAPGLRHRDGDRQPAGTALERVKDIAGQLVKNGKVVNSHRAYLGVRVGETGGQGVYVGSMTPRGPAAKARFKAGDVIVSIAGRPTPTTDALSAVLAGLKPGKTVSVVVRRQEGDKATLHVTLRTLPGG